MPMSDYNKEEIDNGNEERESSLWTNIFIKFGLDHKYKTLIHKSLFYYLAFIQVFRVKILKLSFNLKSIEVMMPVQRFKTR